MKKFMLFLLFFAAFTVGTTGCVFEDVDDEPTAAFACVVVAFCLFCYVIKCVVQALSADEEELLCEALSKTEMTQ